MTDNANESAGIVQRGLWFDEYEEGARYLHRPGRTVTETDDVLFTTLTMNTQPLHLDAHWSSQQPGFGGKRLVNSMWTLSTVVGLSVSQLTLGTIVANPLWGGTFDLTGSYAPALAALPLLLIAGAGILHFLLKEKR